MDAYRINPLTDPRWPALVAHHPQASIFHSTGWMAALHRTYGYEPLAYTTTPPGRELADGVPFCRVRTWLTARRLVSLPFSDHCAPLVDSQQEFDAILAALLHDRDNEHWQYVELRPTGSALTHGADFTPSESFALHTLDLRPGLRSLFRALHKDCVQRKIQRAEREGLSYESGNSESLLHKFYSLLLKTRRRHGLPPQPMQWFRNLISCLGDAVSIRVASRQSAPLAAILTLAHGHTLVYKYGCSDERFSNLGGTQLLFWRAIEEASANGMSTFDLGRSELDNPGLLVFKDRWGATRTPLHYLRCSLSTAPAASRSWPRHLAKYCFSRVPNPFLAAAGRLLYRHIG